MSIKGSAFCTKAGKRGLGKVRKSDKHEVIDMKGVAALEKSGVPAKKILAAMSVK